MEAETAYVIDFDGTVTEKDVSFMILDAFADSAWRQVHNKYQAGEITVGRFNSAVFNMVKADKESIMEAIREKVKIRDGFQDMVALCRSKNFRFVIVSNGLDFYIRAILKGLGLNDIDDQMLREMSKDEIAEYVQAAMLKWVAGSPTGQKIIHMRELERYINEGWRFLSEIPGNKAIVEFPQTLIKMAYQDCQKTLL